MSNGTPVKQINAVGVEAVDAGTGSANAAELTLGNIRSTVGIYWETTGAATLTVEVMRNGGWGSFDELTIDAADSNTEVYLAVPYQDIRAYLDQNRTEVIVTSKGMA